MTIGHFVQPKCFDSEYSNSPDTEALRTNARTRYQQEARAIAGDPEISLEYELKKHIQILDIDECGRRLELNKMSLRGHEFLDVRFWKNKKGFDYFRIADKKGGIALTREQAEKLLNALKIALNDCT